MKNHFIIFIIFFVVSCTEEKPNTNLIDYKLKLEQLEAENIRKDTLLTESIIYFNEIERNLVEIELNEKEINRYFNEKIDSKSNDKQILFKKIKLINELRIQNALKMKLLQNRLDTIVVAQKEFKELIARLQQKIQMKDKTISDLEKKLKKSDSKYKELFTEFQQQRRVLDVVEVQNKEINDELNSVYYVIGTEEELTKYKVIDRKKKVFSSNKLTFNEKLNDKYFIKVNKKEFTELSFHSKKGQLISNHPSSSYVIEGDGKNVKLKIKDSTQFWKFTKYLVVVSS